MKRPLQLIALVGIALSLTSCGLPAALGRTAGNVVKSAGSLAGPALGMGL